MSSVYVLCTAVVTVASVASFVLFGRFIIVVLIEMCTNAEKNTNVGMYSTRSATTTPSSPLFGLIIKNLRTVYGF